MLASKASSLLSVVLGFACCCWSPAAQRQWKSLFDGKKLGRWQVVEEFDFINHGKVEVHDGRLVLGMGRPGTAVRFEGKVPKLNYEISLEAMRAQGDDFFCCVTFPVGNAALSLVVGGWGGSVVGLSLIDDEPAVENETCLYKKFNQNQWYKIRIRVTRSKVVAWIDNKKVVDFQTTHRKLTIYFEPQSALPLGIATWRTTGALRNIRLRRLDAEELRQDAAPAEAPQAPAVPGEQRR
jgi:hypothetical protein